MCRSFGGNCSPAIVAAAASTVCARISGSRTPPTRTCRCASCRRSPLQSGQRCTRITARKRSSPECSPSLDRKSTRLNSSHGYISYAVFCLKKKKIHNHAHGRPEHKKQHTELKPHTETH